MLADTTADDARRKATAKRWAVLYGLHRKEVSERIAADLGVQREEAIGTPDLTVNLLEQVCEWMAVSYQTPPIIVRTGEGADQSAAAVLTDLASMIDLWGLLRKVNRDTLGLRECLVRVGVDTQGRVYARAAWPQDVIAVASDDRPDVPVEIAECRRYTIDGKVRDVYEVHSIRDPSAPTHSYHLRASSGTIGEDVTEQVLGGPAGPYPWLLDDGTPVLPYAWYHAGHPSGLWAPHEWQSLYEATIQTCKLRSFFVHCVQQVSWRQRYAIGLTASAAPIGPGGAPAVAADPSNVLLLHPIDNDGASGTPGSVGSFDVGVDLMGLTNSLRDYMHDAVSSVGLPASDILRTGADPRSGLSLAVSREAQREVQSKYVPQFEAGDRQLLPLLAIALRSTDAPVIPADTRWRTVHQTLALSTEERQRRSAYVRDMRDQKLMLDVEAYLFTHPSATLEEARAALDAIALASAPRETASAALTPVQIAAKLAGAVEGNLRDGKVYEAIAAGRESASITQTLTEQKQGDPNA